MAGHWRDSYRGPRFFMLDGRLAFVLLPAMLHIQKWTILTALVTMGVLYYFEQYQRMSIASALRWMRSSFVTFATGPVRPARTLAKVRHAVDYSRRGR